jgi:hypothetical protein
VPFGERSPRLVGPIRCWRAEDATAVTLTATCSNPLKIRISWRRLSEEGWNPAAGINVTLIGDGKPHTYRAVLSGEHYQGLLTGIALTPSGLGGNGVLSLQSVALTNDR